VTSATSSTAALAAAKAGLSVDPYVIRCLFLDVSFPVSNGVTAYPCYSAYHTGCFGVGPPFYSRRKDGSGLAFPRIKTWPNFICEVCTVRAMLDRELIGITDWKLMCFERMCVLAMSHYWSLGTHAKYQGKLNAISQFKAEFDLDQCILRPTPILRPPRSRHWFNVDDGVLQPPHDQAPWHGRATAATKCYHPPVMIGYLPVSSLGSYGLQARWHLLL
jgi:hypothetical protein